MLWNFLLWAPIHASFLKIEPQKHVLAWPESSVGVRDIWAFAALQLIASLFFWFHNVILLWSFSSHLLCILLWTGITERGSWNYKRFYLFISPSVYPFFHIVALFPKLTSVLDLVEYDPLTAAWNNKASFPHIFSPQDGLSLLHFGPHQSALSVWNLGLKELLITLRGQDSIFTASTPTERLYYGTKSHAFRVRRQ